MSGVLVVSTSYPLRAGARAGTFVRELVEAYAARLPVCVLCPDDDLLPLPSRPGIRAFRYAPRAWQRLAQGAGGVMAALRSQRWLAALIPLFVASMAWHSFVLARRRQAIHANWAICGAVVAPVAWLLRLPMVLTLRGSDVTLAERSILQSMVLRTAVTASAGVVCVSESMALWVRDRFPRQSNKVRSIPNGVGEAFLAVPPPCQASRGAVALLSVGNLIKAKGFHVLLDALATVRDLPWALTIVGDGPELGNLDAQVQGLGLSGRVVLAGALDPAMMPAAYAQCDVFVLPSTGEGRSNVVLEAMAAGRPVVASSIAGIAELLPPEGQDWLVPANEPAMLAAVMRVAIDDVGKRQRLGATNRKHVINSGWTWEGAGDAYADLFECIIGNRKN